MANDRLRDRLRAAGLTINGLADLIGVDPKTVERWITHDRVPHPRHRKASADALDVSPAYLWPDQVDLEVPLAHPEVRALYPTRGHVPSQLWRRCLTAEHQIDILVYSGLFLLDTHPELPTSLKDRASEGLEARFLFGEPSSEVVRARGVDEGIGEGLAARIRISLGYMEPVRDVQGVEVRTHDTVLYNSIYRFDDELLVNIHLAGSGAAMNPVLHLIRTEEAGLFDTYLRSFDRVWQSAAV